MRRDRPGGRFVDVSGGYGPVDLLAWYLSK